MKLKPSYIAIFMILSIINFTWGKQEVDTQHEYCIIQGDNVIIRAKPDVKAKAIGKLEKYEFVYCKGMTEKKMRVGEDEDYWYHIRNCDNNEGWVFGKYVRHIDGNRKHDKYYKKMIEVEIVDRMKCNIENKIKIYGIYYKNDHYILEYEYNEKFEYTQYGKIEGKWIAVYKVMDDKLIKTIHEMDYEYLFYDKYILFFSSKGFHIYDTKKFIDRKGMPPFNIPCKYYEVTGFYLYHNVLKDYEPCIGSEIDCDFYSEMEFNPDTMEVVVNIRIDKDKLLKQEKYKFKDGKFVKVE